MTYQQTSPFSGEPITDWYDHEIELRDADGDKVGKVAEVNPDFIVCESDGGFLGLGEDRRYFIPRSYVSREEDDAWFLSIDKDELESMNWRNAPTESSFATDWSEDNTTLEAREGRTRLRRYEEDVQVDKVGRQAGEVTVSKRVVEDTKTVEVPVRREEVHVERHPVTDDSGQVGNDAFTEQQISVTVMEEDVEVRKVARPVEEIELTKTAVEDTRTVDTTVRREEFDVDDKTKRTDR